ncbi:MAG: hypothetical protein KDA20_09925 [Phycisphaerales bacterium]|nr:hypothetical protein [Phycisphaerales bacterium]
MTRRHTLNCLLLALGALLPLVGCSAPSRNSIMTLHAPGPAEHLAVDVENFRGEVTVIAEPERTDIAIESRVVASKEIPKPDVAAALDSVAIDGAVETDPIQQAGFNTLRVRSTSLRAGATDVHAELTVRVPRCDGARIVNYGGFVELVDVGGALHVDNADGTILVRTSRPLVEPITLLTSNGNIYCQAPEGTAGAVDLHSLDGRIAFKDGFGNASETEYTPQHLRTQLGAGANPIVMRTNVGQVRFIIMEDPLTSTRVVKSAAPSIWNSLYLKGSRRYTLNLPDGSNASVSEPGEGMGPE